MAAGSVSVLFKKSIFWPAFAAPGAFADVSVGSHPLPDACGHRCVSRRITHSPDWCGTSATLAVNDAAGPGGVAVRVLLKGDAWREYRRRFSESVVADVVPRLRSLPATSIVRRANLRLSG